MMMIKATKIDSICNQILQYDCKTLIKTLTGLLIPFL